MTDGSSADAGCVRTAQGVQVRGRVQGVGYRESCVAQARTRGLRGWVRNRADGSVQALLVGPPAAIESMVGWMRRGPALARVDALEREGLPAIDPADDVDFERRATA